jgi:hypothetical protein
MLPTAVTPLTPLSTAPTARDSSATTRDDARAPWSVATDASKAVGRSSENAAVATGRFFTRFGKTVASSF